MSFVLCAAASDSTACSCGCDCGEQCKCGKPSETKESIIETTTADKSEYNDAIAIEEVKIERLASSSSGGYPRIKILMKIRNNYAPSDGETYADRITWDAQLMDEYGDTIKTVGFLYEGIEYGKAVWVERYVDLDMPEGTVSAIGVKKYTLFKLGGPKNSTVIGAGVLSDMPIFPVD